MTEITCPLCGNTDDYSVYADTLYRQHGYQGETYEGVEVYCYHCKSRILKLTPVEIENIITNLFAMGDLDKYNLFD